LTTIVRHFLALAALCTGLLATAMPAGAQTIVDDWTNVTVPPPPAIKAAALDPKTTALLVLDFLRQNCSPSPRCIAALPVVKSLLATARAKGAYVVYSAFPGAQLSDILPDVAPLGGEPFVASTADKFINTDLDKILKAKGITTVIVTGMVAQGAVLNTASDAAQRGYKVVVPIDTMPAPTPYIQQFVTFYLSSAPTISNNVTLTRASMVTF
jgi:nicotinamidase-related amidase